MKKDTYMTLLGFRDTCYNDFNFEVDVKNTFLGTDSYKKIDDILKKVQREDSELLTEFEAGSDIYQDYMPEYLSNTTKHEIQHDINNARDFLDNYDGNQDKKKENYQAFLDDNSLSYAFGADDNLAQVQESLNDIATEEVIVWQRRSDEYILLPHTVDSLHRIQDKISSARKIEDAQLRHSMERLYNNLNNFLKPFSDHELGKYENSISEKLRDELMHFALSVQTDAREAGAEKMAQFALATAKKVNND